jgi:RNA polymerase-binding transcription factor DksA
MNLRMRAELTQALRRRLAVLLKEYADGETELRAMAEDPQPELEEQAQTGRAARVIAGLDDRVLREVAEVHAALQRVIDGSYGKCLDCGRAIPLARLRALPAASSCFECARETEAVPRAAAPAAMGLRHPGRLAPDLDLLLDRDVEEALREVVRQDRRIDAQELRIVCRHGVVRVDGAVPSEGEHQMLLRLLTDVTGCEDVDDHVQVNEILWERPGRSRRGPAERQGTPLFEPIGTEDVVESGEEGLGYLPPDRPPAEEE